MTLSQLSPYRLPLALTLCVTLIALGGSELSALLRFDREAILHGQVWRLFSGHLAHLGWSHWGMNITALALIWALVGDRFSNRQWQWIFAGLCLTISLGLLVFNPALTWYVGLSGVLHGMLVAGVLADIRSGHRSSYALLVLVGAKLIWEQMTGPLPGSELTAGGAVIIDAHLYGGLGGIIFGSLLKPKPGRQQT
jgi:rhomboid family GlyGly-CTERM serine protease